MPSIIGWATPLPPSPLFPTPNRDVVPIHSLQSVESDEPAKVCGECGRRLPLTAFYRSTRDGHQSQCKQCKRAYNAANRSTINVRQAQYLAANPGQSKLMAKRTRESVFRNYGLTVEQYEAMHLEQGGVCAICGRPETGLARPGGKVRSLAVDHDHDTGAVRGLLCGRCNRALGMFGDDPERLRAAALYLENQSATMDGRCAVIR